MRFNQRLSPRWRALVAEVSKFASIGGFNTIVNLVIFNLLLPVGSLKATVVATTVATTCAYFMNRHWTYRHLPKSSLRREYTLYFLFNLAGLAIEMVILYVFDYVLGFDRHTDIVAFNLAKFGGLALGTAFRFWAYRRFVFGSKNAPATSEPVPLQPDGSRRPVVYAEALAEEPAGGESPRP